MLFGQIKAPGGFSGGTDLLLPEEAWRARGAMRSGENRAKAQTEVTAAVESRPFSHALSPICPPN